MIDPATPSDEHTRAAVVFLDMAGFTALTEVHGDSAAADQAERLAGLAAAALDEGDRMVKTLGDAVLLTSPTAASALALIRRVLDAWAADPFGVPVLRGGMHFGPVVQRGGDVYGTTVNLAARVAAAATVDQVLVTDQIAVAARAEGTAVTSLGARRFRNLTTLVDVYALDLECLCGAVDPVCRMRVRPDAAADTVSYAGSDHHFCSTECADRFRSAPHHYLVPADCGLPSSGDGPQNQNFGDID